MALLMFRVAGKLCALPATSVVETMRPLPIVPMPGVPAFVRGASLLRGETTPIVDAGALVNGAVLADPRRLIAIRTARGPVGLLVTDVLGVTPRAGLSLEETPALLSHGDEAMIAELGQRHADLLCILSLGHIVPDEAWAALPPSNAGET